MGHKPQPMTKPARPHFSSGPCAKRPGWSTAVLEGAASGRSHRASISKQKIASVIEKSRSILGIPKAYRCAIVPASDTGAMEMALWSLLGPRGVDLLAWESFGSGWVSDVTKQLKLKDVRVIAADYGLLPDLSEVDTDRDVVFTWNGTTSGVRMPHGDWIPTDRQGLTICDATSAVFSMDLPWERLDVVTWSWQKALGGEAQHGMIALSPRAVARLESFTPPWPMPKIFRLTKNGTVSEGIFRGETINTPSMLCVEDQLDALDWAESIGGLEALRRRAEQNLAQIDEWVDGTEWVDFLARETTQRSSTSVCLRIVSPWFESLASEQQAKLAKSLVDALAECGVAYDIGSYRDAPPGLRIWTGPTVEVDDIRDLLPWLDWAFHEVAHSGRSAHQAA